MNNSFLNAEELAQIDLESYGMDVLFGRRASFYSPGKISLFYNVRIDVLMISVPYR
jgi:hypothetical protein